MKKAQDQSANSKQEQSESQPETEETALAKAMQAVDAELAEVSEEHPDFRRYMKSMREHAKTKISEIDDEYEAERERYIAYAKQVHAVLDEQKQIVSMCDAALRSIEP